MAAMDYDPYDALLHHVYQQVRYPGLRTFFFLFVGIAHVFEIRHREKRGSGPRRNASRQVSVFALKQAISESFRITSPCWSRLRRQSDC